jgi:hypothetical protein
MTKSKLLASTMLVAAATAMSAVPANAVNLKIGGFGEYWIGYADNDRGTGADADSNFDVKQDAELYFHGEETLDNGMKIGARFELEAGNGNDNASGPGFDESWAWVKTSFGQVNIGNNDVATGYVGGVSTVGPVGIIKSDASDWFAGSVTELNNTDVDLGLGDSQNITYFTPRVAGFQAIVSYTPDSSDTTTSDFDDQEVGGLHNGFSMAVKYSGKFSGASVNLSGGYTTVERTDATTTDNEASGYAVRGSIGYGAFTVTGAYAREDISDTDEFWGISGLYTMGKHKFSLAYGIGTETNPGQNIGDNENEVVTLGWERNLGKGATIGASVFRMSNERAGVAAPAAALNDGYGVVTGLKLKF